MTVTTSAPATAAADIERLSHGIRRALEVESGRLESHTVTAALELLQKTESRLGLGLDRTVVAFAGSTGSGKSSLFNAVSGLEIAQVGVRRPTTSKPTACVWGDGGEEFLTWLGVPVDNRTWRESALDGDDEEALHGLILLDLPDHDSTAVEHRAEADRLVGMVDLVIWVVDPQKYADFSLHSRYLSKLSQYSDSMVVVLNQVDRLHAGEQEATKDHLRGLLKNDGLDNVEVRLASAKTRQGIPELRKILTQAIAHREAGLKRLYADVRSMADEIQRQLGKPVGDPEQLPGADKLTAAMADAAGVEAVAQTVHDDYVRRAYRKTGYPILAWMQRGKADPLGAKHGGDRAELIRAAIPETTRTQSARVHLAAHDLVAAATQSLPVSWRQAVDRAERQSTAELTHTLDEAVTSVAVTPAKPGWWALAQFCQVLFFSFTLLAVLWLLVDVVALFAAPDLLNQWMWIAPAGVLVIAVTGSLITSSAAAKARRSGARRASDEVREQLNAAVQKAAQSSYLAPIATVLREHKEVYDGLS